MQSEIVIVDSNCGNLFSVYNAFKFLNANVVVSSDKTTIKNARAIILPGVGAYKDAMGLLMKEELNKTIVEIANNGTPIFGICLGMQLLFDESSEFGNTKGLGLLQGKVHKFTDTNKLSTNLKIPNVGWRKLRTTPSQSWDKTPLNGLSENDLMYFVHSYYVVPENKSSILAETSFGELNFCSVIKQDNIFATQFHPEKSAKSGLKIFKNWLSLLN